MNHANLLKEAFEALDNYTKKGANKMTTTNEAQAWYLKNIPNPKALDDKVTATLEYVKRFNEPDEEGDWVVFAYEIIDGHHGQYTVRMFIDEVMEYNYEEEKAMNTEDLDAVMGTFDEVGHELADVFNQHSKLPGTFYVGHNEADGSLGVFYSVKA